MKMNIEDDFNKALDRICFSIQRFTVLLEKYERCEEIHEVYHTTSSSFTQTHILISHEHIANALMVMQEIAPMVMLDQNLVTTLQQHDTAFYALEESYQHLKATRFNLNDLHQDYRTYAATFNRCITAYDPQESIEEHNIYVLANNQSVRQFLEVLYQAIPLHERTQHDHIQNRLDTLLLEHTPQAFIDFRASWNDPQDLLMELEPKIHWWWYREGYQERGR